jgi:predicted enzyme related to lactoylglutathione lyase
LEVRTVELHRDEEERQMPIDIVMAGIAVADFDAAVPWYERLLGRRADDRPMDGSAEWRLRETGGI